MADEGEEREIDVYVYETGGWFMALCKSFPGVTGSGKTRDECIADLRSKLESGSDDAPSEDPPSQ